MLFKIEERSPATKVSTQILLLKIPTQKPKIKSEFVLTYLILGSNT